MADAAEDLTPDEQAFEAGLSGNEPEAPATDEPDKGESTEDKAEGDDATEDEPDKDEADKSETDEDKSKDEGDKPDPKETNRAGYAARQATKQQVTASLDKLVRPQTVDELIENQGLDPAEAKVEALRQEMQRDRAIAEINELNNGLRSDAQNIVRDFPIFDENSEDYDKNLAEETDALWREAADLKTNDAGDVVLQARVAPYRIYAAVAAARAKGIELGETRGQKAAETMLASTEAPAAAKPKPADSDLNDEDKLFLKGLSGGQAQ